MEIYSLCMLDLIWVIFIFDIGDAERNTWQILWVNDKPCKCWILKKKIWDWKVNLNLKLEFELIWCSDKIFEFLEMQDIQNQNQLVIIPTNLSKAQNYTIMIFSTNSEVPTAWVFTHC